MVSNKDIESGKPLPFGVTRTEFGHNFALYSKNATAVTLQLYQQKKPVPDHEIIFDPSMNRTGDVWHIQIKNLPSRFYYTFSIDGPHQPEKGHLFDSGQVLLDPYAVAVAGLENWGERDPELQNYFGLFEEMPYDWGDDQPPNIPLQNTVIYELHVRGFTRHPESGVACPGTFKGITEKIDYLKALGITAVELMPVHEFDETDCRYVNPETGTRLLNYWGYSTIGFFALKTGFAAAETASGAVREFKDMIRALHKESIEVILDVVFNHTAEGDLECPVFNFKGIENSTYYILDEQGDYRNYSGCGNTVNSNHPVVQKLILDALRYWVVEMHVDGFRFDLASILTRDESGEVMKNPPLLVAIASDPVLSGVKIIAEAWDASGLYQVGSFPAWGRWAEWNGRYRDTIRRFATGEPGLIGEVASRISGSEDLYRHSGRHPYHSVNFLTSHDGFTMMDLVSYTRKHNLANGQENVDGHNQNYSINMGIEGETKDPVILEQRKKQIRNLATLLMISQGIPMMLAGDEFGNSQLGNNNAWCQDNDISWLNWQLLSDNRDLFDFWRKLIAFRKKHASLQREHFFTGEINTRSGLADISWHNVQKGQPGFDTPARSLAFMIDESSPEEPGKAIYVAANFSFEPLEFELPTVDMPNPWHLILSTAEPEPFINDVTTLLPPDQSIIKVVPFSISVLTY